MLPPTAYFLAAFVQVTSGYGIFFFPGAVISKFDTYMTLPSVSPGPGVHYIWPGLEPNAEDFVFQDVAGDQWGNGWTFAEWIVDNHGGFSKSSNINVYPGDSIGIWFNLNLNTGEWTDIWEVNPGATGAAAGERYSVSNVIIGKDQAAAWGNLTQVGLPVSFAIMQTKANTIYAMFVIELYNATWNFGPLTFENIVIEAQTTNLTWCTSTPYQGGSFTYSMATPIATVVNNAYSRCSIASLTLLAPLA